AGVRTTSAALLEYLRDHPVDRPDPERIERLVRRLGARRWADRNRATRDLVRLGKFSRERLLRASEDKDQEPEVTMRARDCREQIRRLGGREPLRVEQAAARLLIKRREAAALEVLLKPCPPRRRTPRRTFTTGWKCWALPGARSPRS